MKQKILTAALLMNFIFAGCAFAVIDLGEGYNVPENFSSVIITSSDGTAIQNAVERIQSGGTILLSGDFNLKRDINIKKNLTIKGQEGSKAVLNETASYKRVIRCQGNITLENLIIKGGSSTNGGGVKLDGGEVNIISCDITGNTGLLGGGGIHSQANKLTLTNCNISDNKAMLTGGGISAIAGTITMTNCKINSNEAQFSYGGGLAASGSNITIDNCEITGNKANTQGGGIALVNQASLKGKDSISFEDNTAPESAEVYCEAKSTIE